MNLKAFFVAALQSALDLEMGTCEDVVRHVTPDVLAEYLPKPLWARLLTAAIGAPRVDATLVVETIGIANLCEHVPGSIMWACLQDIGSRALGGYVPPVKIAVAAPVAATPPRTLPATPLMTPPPDVLAPSTVITPPPPPPLATPSIPAPLDLDSGLNELVSELNADDRPATPARPRAPAPQRFRPSNTGIGRLAQPANARKSQAQAAVPDPLTAPAALERGRTPPRRGSTEVSDYEVETDVGSPKDDWKNALAVEDEQLVDWSSSEETVTSGDDYQSGRRK